MMSVERRVFLAMSPVISEQYVTDEQLDEFKRRSQRLVPVGLYLVLPAVLVVLAFVGSDYELFHKGVGFLLALAGFATLAIGVLRVRDLIIERRILRAAGLGSKVLTFRNLGYWPPISHVLPLGPPDTVNVLFPERLVIACDNKPLKTFKPIALTIFEDLPWPDKTEKVRTLTPMESEEIGRRLIGYKWSTFSAAFMIVTAVAFMVLGVAQVVSGDLPNLMTLLMPFGLWVALGKLVKSRRMAAILLQAKATAEVSVDWDGSFFREHLQPGELIWRDETGPAKWRRVSEK